MASSEVVLLLQMGIWIIIGIIVILILVYLYLMKPHAPKTVREKAINSAIRLVTRAKIERENKIEVEKHENGGYTITFTLFDRGTELMKLSIYVVDSLQLEQVKQNFINDPVKVYSSIITSLTV